MGSLLRLVIPVLVGLAVARTFDIHDLDDSSVYFLSISLLLSIGLYGSTFQIDTEAAGRDKRTILLAITVGVAIKAALIGGVLALLWRDPLFLVLGVAVAQIDPLAVAAALRHPRMSPRARSILASWSSFDDPITVLASVYTIALVARLEDGGSASVPGSAGAWDYAADLLANGLFVLGAFVAWRLVRRYQPAVYVLLAVLLAVAVWQFTMLGMAVAGLFIRPPGIDRGLDRAVRVALIAAAFMLGLLLTRVSLVQGGALGVAAFSAQIVVGLLLTLHLPVADRVRLAFAQQNGITAITLALLLEAEFDGVVAVVAPAIIVINVIHLYSNRIIDRLLPDPPGP